MTEARVNGAPPTPIEAVLEESERTACNLYEVTRELQDRLRPISSTDETEKERKSTENIPVDECSIGTQIRSSVDMNYRTLQMVRQMIQLLQI